MHPTLASLLAVALALAAVPFRATAAAADPPSPPPARCATGAPQDAPAPPPPAPPAPSEDATPGEREWQDITDELTPKLVRLRELPPEERRKETFRGELARIGEFVRKYQQLEPDVAASARIFMATQVLWQGLGRDREAVAVLRDVASTASHGVVAGLAALSCGEILLRGGDEAGLRQLYELYSARADPDPLFRDALEGLCRQVRLLPGRPLPAIPLHDLAGRPIEPAALRGKLVVLVVFNATAPAAREAFASLARLHARLRDPGLQPIGLSLDPDRKPLIEWLEELGVDFPVDCSGKEWESPAVRELGLTQIPATILVDPAGTILFARTGALGAQFDEIVATHLAQLREAGQLPARRPGG